jgi:hypothetical protein
MQLDLDSTVPRRALLIVFSLWAAFPFSAAANKDKLTLIPTKILRSDTVYVDCSTCPRALAAAGRTAPVELRDWGRFRVVGDPRNADLIFMYSGNPYQGDYITRDGPDTKPVMIETTFMTIIDPKTGESLWMDARKWGSLRVASATKDLIGELRHQMESQVKTWTLDQILECNHATPYAGFAFLTSEQALARGGGRVERVPDVTDRLIVNSTDVPEFCRRAGLILGPEHKTTGYEVITYGDETLDVADVLEKADQFDFSSGKYANTETVFFSARRKDNNVLIEFRIEGHRSVLSRVTYFY